MSAREVKIKMKASRTTPAVREFYRGLRRVGLDRETANYMTFGALLSTGGGHLDIEQLKS